MTGALSSCRGRQPFRRADRTRHCRRGVRQGVAVIDDDGAHRAARSAVCSCVTSPAGDDVRLCGCRHTFTPIVQTARAATRLRRPQHPRRWTTTSIDAAVEERHDGRRSRGGAPAMPRPGSPLRTSLAFPVGRASAQNLRMGRCPSRAGWFGEHLTREGSTHSHGSPEPCGAVSWNSGLNRPSVAGISP